ncbi:hypothetical protein EYC80_002202 [Monilinia laxa]|uniref:Uncharacterized protein n=1 Tax=Monilinia laxa TaxID=61186 RepID=A0A5N6K345_MONLA|nr:hypothetical protein EYC80_002202 [Monilinia laxa]
MYYGVLRFGRKYPIYYQPFKALADLIRPLKYLKYSSSYFIVFEINGGTWKEDRFKKLYPLPIFDPTRPITSTLKLAAGAGGYFLNTTELQENRKPIYPD